MGSFLEWTAIVSVFDADAATMMRGRFFKEATLCAGTITAAAAPSPVGEASSKLIGVATMDDFSNLSGVIFSCRRANGLCDGIGMGVDRERREVSVFPAKLMHVTLHDERVQSDE